MKIKGSVVLVTGGGGFIGSHLIDKLLTKNPKKIIILDNFSRGTDQNIKDALKHKNVELVKGDVRDFELLDKLTKNSDYVFHLAAIRITQCAEDPRLCQEILVNGTFNVLNACAKNKVKKFIFSSSASVYGNPSYMPMDEKHPFNNTTAYGAAKIASEEMAKAFKSMYDLNYVILRYFNIYGPRMDIYGVYTEVLMKWLDAIDRNTPPIIHGDGKQALDFVYVGDIVNANIRALESDINEGVFNVGTGKSTSLKDLLGILLELTGSKLRPIYQKNVKRPYVQKRAADITLAKKTLGFVAKTELKNGLKKLIQWRKGQITARKLYI
jgi:UDP-glucose 4-epimerase